MEVNIKGLFLFIFAGAILFWGILKVFVEDDFEKLDQEYLDIPNLADYDNDPHLINMFDEIQEDGIKFKDVYSSLSNRFIPTYYNDKYWVVKTGVTTIDDGIKVFFLPTYTRIIVIERQTKEIVINKLFFKQITNAVLKDGYIYFRYNHMLTWELLSNIHRIGEVDEDTRKLGRVKLEESAS